MTLCFALLRPVCCLLLIKITVDLLLSGLIVQFYCTQTILHYVRFQVLMAASMKFRVFWDVVSCSHVGVERASALMMEAVRISEMLVNFNMTTWHYIPEDSKTSSYTRWC
jgi:hypothetical protein